MIRENVDVYQTETVNNDQQLKQAVLGRLEAFKAEVREIANGRTFTTKGRATVFPDGTRYAHLRFQFLDEEVSDTKIIKLSTMMTEEYSIGVYDSPVLEAG
ncbi:hypothetical protein LCGC14_0470810 [marine sediment metagenome]|uniref:Uncharacterized protein n=1 Tax=marine sediment metagenome TaxID=412755 RepID=A0A0F9SV71_9ZZZZ